MFEHFSCEEYDTVSGSFSSSCQSAVGKTLSGENAFISVDDSLILSEQVSDLSGAYAQIPCRNIGIRSDMSV